MKLFWGSIVFISFACFATVAFGQGTTTWQTTNGVYTFNQSGSFNDASKWSNGVPNSNTQAVISVYNYTIFNGIGQNNNTLSIAVPAGQSAANLQFQQYFNFNGDQQGTININIASGAILNVSGNFLSAGTNSLVVSQGVITNINGGSVNILTGDTVVGDIFGLTDVLNLSQTNVTYGNGIVEAVGSGLVTNGIFGALSGTNTIIGGEVGIVTQNQTSVSAGSNFDLRLGTQQGSSGVYSLSNGSTLSLGESGTISIGSSGSAFNVDSSSSVTLGSGSRIDVGTTKGDNAQFNLAGALNVNTTQINVGAFGSIGTLNQTGGNITGSAMLYLGGDGGTGTYNFSGGTATFSQGMSVGQREFAGTGVLNQSGATTLTVANGDSIGTAGVGTYNFSGGTATFTNGLAVGSAAAGSKGTVNQSGNTTLVSNGSSSINATGVYNISGGTATFNSGLALTGTLNVNGGTFFVGRDQLTGQGAGTINGGGGTLALFGGTTGTYTYAFGGSLTGGTTTIDVSATPTSTFTFAGAVTGAAGAGLLLNGNGSTVFNFADFPPGAGASNSVTGVNGVSNGTLNATQNDIANTSGLVLGNAGTLNLNLNSGGLAYGGNVSGPGTLVLNFFNASGDAFVMSNSKGFSGAVIIGGNGNSGTLQIYSGTFSNLSDNGSGSNVVVGGNPLTGNVTVPSSGLVVLPGNNSYSGSTTISPGFTVQASNFSGNVINNGTLANLGFPLNTSPINGVVDNMNIGGSLNSTGVIDIFTDGQNADRYTVKGAGTSTLSGVVNTIGSGTGKYAIVTTGGNLLKIGGNGNLNDPNGLTTQAPLTLFSSYLTDDLANGILYDNTVQKPLIGFATTPAERAVANALDPMTQTPPRAFAPLLLIFNGLPANQIGPALQSLSPINYQYDRIIDFENATFMVQKINGVLSSMRSGYSGLNTDGLSFSAPGDTSLSQSMRSMLASNAPSFHTTAPNGVNYYPDDGSSSPAPASDYAEPSSAPARMTPANAASPTSYDGQVMSDSPIPMRASSPPTLRTSAFSEFVAGDVALADINQNSDTLSKATYTAGDIAAGVGYRVTSNLTVGVLFDFNHTNAKTDGNGSTTQINSYMPGIFATFFEKGFYANGLFSFGYNQYNTSNAIPLGGQGGTSSSSTSGMEYIGNVDLGYDFHPAKQWVVGPTLGLTYTNVNIDGFTQSGLEPVVSNLHVHSQDVDSFRSRLGGHVEYITAVGNIILQPNLTAMWQHEYINNNPDLHASFTDYPIGAFQTPLSPTTQDTALLGCGLTATLNNSLAFYLNYLADVGGGDYLAQSIVLGVKASF